MLIFLNNLKKNIYENWNFSWKYKNGWWFFSILKIFIFIIRNEKFKSKIEVIISHKEAVNYLKEKNINTKLFSQNTFIGIFRTFFEIDLIKNLFDKIKIRHPFTRFIKKNKYDLIIFLGPSIMSKFCAEISFVSNIWDVDHKKIVNF